MTVRLLDFFTHYQDEPHQRAAVQQLEESMPSSLLKDDAAWVETFRAAVPIKAEPSPSPAITEAWLTPARSIVQAFEGCRLTAYLCPAGVWTIGWGSLVMPGGGAVRDGDQITQQEADDLLDQQLRMFAGGCRRLLPAWSQTTPERQAALISWAFNVGLGAVESSTLRRRLATGEDPAVVVREELPRWNKANGKPLEGLTRRRAAEVALFTGKAAAPVKTSGLVMVGPAKSPTDFGFKAGDHHLVMNDAAQMLTAWNAQGQQLWKVPALARGQGADTEWTRHGTDTPPGLYRIGAIYRDYETSGGAGAAFTADRRAYGWYSFDLVELEDQERKHGRAGIMIHGGGSAAGWPGAWAPRQPLFPTLGCIRCHNIDLREKLLPLTTAGTVFVSVYQERG